MDNNHFIRSIWSAGFLLGGIISGCSAEKSVNVSSGEEGERKPDILIIVTDQQSADMLSAVGNPWLKTPNLDRLVRDGYRFEKAFCSNPVSLPSRFSLLSGRYPADIGIRENQNPAPRYKAESDRIMTQTLGHIFKKAGYETLYGGKVHYPDVFTANKIHLLGFENISLDEREGLARTGAQIITKRSPDDAPLLMVLSFINPHDICFDKIRGTAQEAKMSQDMKQTYLEAEKKPAGISDEEFFKNLCPPLAPNSAPMKNEPKGYLTLGRTAPRKWTDRRWRMHSWAYHRLTERVDREIGTVLAALQNSRISDNTIVVFTSDHGEMNGAHGFESKGCFYQEAVRIPFIFYGKGIRKGIRDESTICSNGIDLFPTLCDLAGIEIPSYLYGESLKGVLTGSGKTPERKYVVSEDILGFMITDGRYKYCMYQTANREEMLIDLKNDPLETVNLASDERHAAVKRTLRTQLEKHLKNRGIDYTSILPRGEKVI